MNKCKVIGHGDVIVGEKEAETEGGGVKIDKNSCLEGSKIDWSSQ